MAADNPATSRLRSGDLEAISPASLPSTRSMKRRTSERDHPRFGWPRRPCGERVAGCGEDGFPRPIDAVFDRQVRKPGPGALAGSPAEGTGRYSSSKKSLPLSSTTMNAGKLTTSILRTASIPRSSKSRISTFLMLSWARIAAGPPIDPR